MENAIGAYNKLDEIGNQALGIVNDFRELLRGVFFY